MSICSDVAGMKNEQTRIDQIKALKQLQSKWWRCSFFSVVAVFICFFSLLTIWQPKHAWQWLFQTLFVLAYVLRLFRVALSRNFRPGEEILLGTIGPGSCVTFLRGLMISMLAGFFFLPWPGKIDGPSWLTWVPGVIYILAAFADFFDGYLARITHHETEFGKILDTKIDALGLLIAPALAVFYGQLPIFYLAVSGAYYLFVFGSWLRKKEGKYLVELKPRPSSRLIAGLHMGFVGVALLPLLSPPVTTIAALILMTPLLLGFVRDWLVVSGRIRTESDQRANWEHGFNRLMTMWLPIFLRVVVLCAGFFLLQPFAIRGSGYWASTLIVFLIMVVFGVMGRTAAILISFSAAYTINKQGTIPELLILYACAVALMWIGTGTLSLWKPEDRIFLRRAGERDESRTNSA